jgi:hypothetical protein
MKYSRTCGRNPSQIGVEALPVAQGFEGEQNLWGGWFRAAGSQQIPRR